MNISSIYWISSTKNLGSEVYFSKNYGIREEYFYMLKIKEDFIELAGFDYYPHADKLRDKNMSKHSSSLKTWQKKLEKGEIFPLDNRPF